MNEYDVVIIGGGAAGLSAALVLSRARRTVLVVDSGQPRNAPAAHMHGFLSRDGMVPGHLLTMLPTKLFWLYHTDTSGFYEGALYPPMQGPSAVAAFCKDRTRSSLVARTLSESISARFAERN